MSDNIGSPQTSYVWLNGSSSEPLESTTIRGEVEKINRQYRFCSNPSDCEAYLKAQSSNGPIVLIISGSLGRELVPKIHDLPQVIRIHVYCYDKSLHEKWAGNFTKVKGVFIEFNELLRSLSLNSSSADTDSSSNNRVTEASSADVPVETVSTTVTTPEINQPTTDASLITPQESVLPKDEPIPAPPTEAETTASPAPEQTASPFLYEADTTYHIATACSDLITRMSLRPEEIGDYVSFCRDASSGNEQPLAAVEEFRTNYSRDTAITYLYSDTFSWPYLDNIFKAGYIDGIYSSRVLIRDIEKQLEQHKCATVTRVYLCELMFNEDFQRLQTFNGRIIAMKYFLWTNTDREKAIANVSYDASNSECKRLLYEIEADPQTANVKPFAKLDSVSTINDPEQVLVMIGSLLRITAIEDEKDGIINIKAQLCGNDDDNEIAKQINQIKHEHIDSNGVTDTVKFGQFQIALGNTFGDTNLCNSGEKHIRDYHNKLQIDSIDHIKCCCALGNLEFTKGEYDSSLANYQKAFDLKTNSSTVNDLELAAIHNALGSVYYELNQYDQALDHYQKAVQIWRTFNYDFHLTLVSCYTNMGHIHMQSDRYTDAFYYYSQAEIILIKNNDTNSFIYALCCHNLGTVRNSLQQYHLALGHFKTSLKIKSTFLEPLNPSIASTYRCIGTVYRSMDYISQARDMFQQTLEIYRQAPSPDDATISEVEQMIQDLPNEST